MAYITLTDIKTRLGISGTAEDTKLQSMIDASIAYIEEYTGRNFSGANKVVTEEEHDITPINIRKDYTTVFLRNVDVNSVSEVKLGYIDEVLLPSDAYRLSKTGRLAISGRAIRSLIQQYDDLQDIKVTYSYGYRKDGVLSTPASINEVIAGAVENMRNKRFSGASSEKIGDYQINHGSGGGGSFKSGSGAFSGGSVYTADMLAILDGYKVYNLGG